MVFEEHAAVDAQLHAQLLVVYELGQDLQLEDLVVGLPQ